MALHWKKSLHSRPGPWREKLLPLLGERAGVREIVASLLHGYGLDHHPFQLVSKVDTVQFWGSAGHDGGHFP
jgi:hypothetical protein